MLEQGILSLLYTQFRDHQNPFAKNDYLRKENKE